MNKDTLTIKGSVRCVTLNKEGVVVADSGWIKNLITNVGKAAMAGLVGNTGAVSAFNYIAVGSSSTAPAATDTALGTEISTSGLSRTTATASRVTTTLTNDTLQLTVTFSVTGTATVQEVGVFNASSSGIILGHALTGSQSLINTNTFQVTYKIQFT